MRSRWLSRALLASALAGATLLATGGTATASEMGEREQLQQTQDATNSNSTSQDAAADASTHQVNVNAPIAIFSPRANGGDVDQSNDADTTAVAGNANSTDQGIEQGQSAQGRGSCKHACGRGSGDVDQSQEATNDNYTDQTADATATTEQWNVNAPVSVLGFGRDGHGPKGGHDPCGCQGHHGGGDVDQSNDADTTAVAWNDNETDQWIGQHQTAGTGGSGGHHGCGCGHGGGDIDQTQSGSNDNSTTQDATANASTEQWNVNAPFALFSSGANSGDVDQSNDATTTAWAGNSNDTDQSVEQGQDARTGGNHGCGCGHGGGDIDQDQTADNYNSTDQTASADATTHQVNVNAPIAVFSPGANGGDVSQSNDATTTAGAYNTNETDQSVDQDQDANAKGSRPSVSHDKFGHPGDCGCGGDGGDVDQTQTGSNSNETTQDASANAETDQVNVNVPVSVLSPGSNGGDVDQSNDADTTALAGNSNSTTQTIDQGQDALTL